MPRPKGHVIKPLAERFAEKVERLDDGCWRWTGHTDAAGYGRLRGHGRDSPVLYAHRFAYEQAKGAIPERHTVDHLCRNRWCVNPDHLEAVTVRLNTMRGESPNVQRHRTGVCSRGHEQNDTNTQYKSDGTVAYCRICRNERRRVTPRTSAP
jgi:hypothetical protein